MQKLLLELGGPLVIAAVLLGLAKIIRGVIEHFKGTPPDDPEDAERRTE